MEEQVCKKCGKTLPLDSFGRHKHMKTGYLKTCKRCALAESYKRRNILKLNPAWVKNRNKTAREYLRIHPRVSTPESNIRRVVKHQKRYPEKRAAAIACIKLPKMEGFQRHHWSYNEEHRKDVIPLTVAQHYLVHRHTIYDQERMMYRRLDGTLIDSREAAIAYYATLKDS